MFCKKYFRELLSKPSVQDTRRVTNRTDVDPKNATEKGRYDTLKNEEENIMPVKYSDAFKLEVVRDYYNSPLGVGSIALKYNGQEKH